MSKMQLATGAGALLAFLFGAPFVSGQGSTVGAILDGAGYICSSAHALVDSSGPPAESDRSGIEATGDEHQHPEPAGLYMPMFSTPPKGGAVYNGPPLDQC